MRHSFAKLGAATEKANGCVVHDTTEDGEPRVRKLHDSSGQRPPRSAPRGQAVRARAMPPQAIGQRPQPSSAVCAWKPEVTRRDPSAPARGACRANLVPPQAQVAVGHRRDTALLHRHLDAIDDVTRTAQWMRRRVNTSNERSGSRQARSATLAHSSTGGGQSQTQRPSCLRVSVCVFDSCRRAVRLHANSLHTKALFACVACFSVLLSCSKSTYIHTHAYTST